MEDVLTEQPPPSRFFAEDLAVFVPPSPALPPPFLLLTTPHHPQPAKLLIILISPPSLSLFYQLSSIPLAGTLILPEVPLSPFPSHRSFRIYSAAGGHTLIAAAQSPISSDRAKSVAKVLLDGIAADRVVIFDSLKSGLYRGRLAADEVLAFKLETAAEKAVGHTEAAVRDVEYLPSGSVADGFGAAMLAGCQMRNIKGTLVLTWPDNGYASPRSVIKRMLNDLGIEVGENDKEEFGSAVISDLYT